MTPAPECEFVDANLDLTYLVNTLVRLLKIPTQVPLGPATLMEPDDPKLLHYVQEVIRPELAEIGCYEIIDAPLNQLVVRYGSGKGKTLLVMAYTPTQHNNFMRDPFSGKIAIPRELGIDEPCAFGQGASQNKAHMAAMLAVMKMLARTRVPLDGTLYFAVNNEGRSSHACSDALLTVLDRKPDGAIILIGVDSNMDISVGNRGRVDIYVHVYGKASHSSAPNTGLNAIEGVNEVLNRLRTIELHGEHPQLGKRHLEPYQIVYEPVAPHTLPGYAKLTLDRRLLPGDSLSEAVAQVQSAIGDLSPFRVHVEQGVYMLPAVVEPGSAIVRELQSAVEMVRGAKPKPIYLQSSFDAGGLCAAGVPTVMWGVSGPGELLGDDFVPLAAVRDEARVLGCLALRMLGGTI